VFPRAALGLGIALLWPVGGLRADEPPRWPFEAGPSRDAEGPSARPDWIRLFGLQPAFLSDPLGLDYDEPPGQPPEPDTGPEWLQLSMGNDNPFFDLRRRGDPGGIGYYRVVTQAKLVDTYSTIFAVGMQAVTPAGRDTGGLQNGPTVVSPGFSLFHAFTSGTAVQGYLGKNFHLGDTDTYRLPRSARYAVAVQQPLGDELSGLNNVFFFVEALGSYRYDASAASPGPAARWDVLPGVHWKLADNWWLSGGVGMPVQNDGLEHHFWQFTCTLQF
jgi:hypothetical protein